LSDVRWPTISRFRPRSTSSTGGPVPPPAPEQPEPTVPPAIETATAAAEPSATVAPRAAPDQGRRRIGRPAAPRQERAPVRWNIWALERVAREHPESEELGFLVLSLREFADSAGQLPTDFDPLVRESFGDLLAG
jgi:hypothetical protein